MPAFSSYVTPSGQLLRTEDEIDSSHKAECRPDIVSLERLFHINHCKRHKDAERDDLLEDLELCKAESLETDTVGRYLEEILTERNPPADEGRNVPGF